MPIIYTLLMRAACLGFCASFRSIFLFSSVMCHRHTPSSKRNLSSKIHHKSSPSYCLMLTKMIYCKIFQKKVQKSLEVKKKCVSLQSV